MIFLFRTEAVNGKVGGKKLRTFAVDGSTHSSRHTPCAYYLFVNDNCSRSIESVVFRKRVKTGALPIRSVDGWVSLCQAYFLRGYLTGAVRKNGRDSMYPLYPTYKNLPFSTDNSPLHFHWHCFTDTVV